MPMTLTTLLAGLPILLVLALMLGLRWSAARAGSAGLLVCCLLAWWVFGFGTRSLPELGPGLALAGGMGEALFTSATILWIIFPALCIHELQRATGALDQLLGVLARLSSDPRLSALLIAWFFSLFMEGAAGFGTSAALAAPFLVSAGFGRVEAVAIALIGHAIGVSFGAVGTPILPQLAATPYSPQTLSAATGIYHSLLGWLMALAVMGLILKAMPKGVLSTAALWRRTLLAAVLFLVPYHLLSRYVGPELPTLAGAVVGGTLFVSILIMTQQRKPAPAAGAVPSSQLWRAAAPYIALIVLVLLTRLIPELRHWLSSHALQWEIHGFRGSIAVLYHPGSLLFASFLVGAGLQGASARQIAAAMCLTLRRLGPVTLALVAMLGLSRVMVHAGMIETLAMAAAATAGGIWPLFAPLVGMLGTFVTGSATASNILLTDFQQATASRLDLPVLPLLGAQGFGAAVGNMICPHNIIAAGATVQLAGREGDVMRRTLPIALGYGLLGGLLALLWLT